MTNHRDQDQPAEFPGSPKSRSSAGSSEPTTIKRAIRACDSCYKRKIKCDGSLPQCDWCKHHQVLCTFSREKRPKRKRRDQDIGQRKALEERMNRIEALLAEKLQPKHDDIKDHHQGTPSTPGTEVSAATPQSKSSNLPKFGTVHFAGHALGDVSSYSLLTFSKEGQEWIKSCTGETASIEKMFSFTTWKNQWFSWQDIEPSLEPQKDVVLPDKNLVRELVFAFNNSIVYDIFPVLPNDFVSRTLEMAYDSPIAEHSAQHFTAKVFVFAFLTFTSGINLGIQSPIQRDGEVYSRKTHSMSPKLINLPASVDGLAALTTLALCEIFSGNLQVADCILTLASRYIFYLGAHIAPHPEPESSTASRTSNSITRGSKTHHARNLFWICYHMDKDLAIRTGRPPVFNDDHCDLTLPPEYGIPMDPNPYLRNCVFPGDIRLGIIKARAYDGLYSMSAIKKSDAELVKTIRELDNDLEAWRMMIPPEVRPTITFSREVATNSIAVMNMHSVMLRLDYYHCLASIHQSTSRCETWREDQTGLTEGINSSLAICVEASRSALQYLRAAEHTLIPEAFCVILFYSTSAIVTVFCNILLTPLDAQAKQDLNLLQDAIAGFRRTAANSRPDQSFKEILHIRLTEDFISELVRLAQCAITKAQKDAYFGQS